LGLLEAQSSIACDLGASTCFTAPGGRRGRKGIVLHKGRLHAEDRAERDGIPVTSVAHTIFDLAAAHDEDWMRGVFEEADRLRILRLDALRRACERGAGRRGLGAARRLADEAIAAENDPASFLEDLFFTFCRKQRLPLPRTNVHVLGCEVDALWEEARLIVELDGWGSHRHRAAFERDRIRDADHAVAGYKVIRVTYRRLKTEPQLVAIQLRATARRTGAGRLRPLAAVWPGAGEDELDGARAERALAGCVPRDDPQLGRGLAAAADGADDG